MSDPRNILAAKTVSMLFADAKMGFIAGRLFGWTGRLSASATKHLIGGYWVSGKLYLTPDAILYEPRRLDGLFYKNSNELRTEISWRELRNVEQRSGLVTQIVDLNLDTKTYSFRCHGAKQFVQKIRDAQASAV